MKKIISFSKLYYIGIMFRLITNIYNLNIYLSRLKCFSYSLAVSRELSSLSISNQSICPNKNCYNITILCVCFFLFFITFIIYLRFTIYITVNPPQLYRIFAIYDDQSCFCAIVSQFLLKYI